MRFVGDGVVAVEEGETRMARGPAWWISGVAAGLLGIVGLFAWAVTDGPAEGPRAAESNAMNEPPAHGIDAKPAASPATVSKLVAVPPAVEDSGTEKASAGPTEPVVVPAANPEPSVVEDTSPIIVEIAAEPEPPLEVPLAEDAAAPVRVALALRLRVLQTDGVRPLEVVVSELAAAAGTTFDLSTLPDSASVRLDISDVSLSDALAAALEPSGLGLQVRWDGRLFAEPL